MYFTRPLLRVVEGSDDDLWVKGHLDVKITPAVEGWINEFPKKVIVMFNYFSTRNEQLDYASESIVYMPDEFGFHFDVEHLGRLAREFLIAHLLQEAMREVWALPIRGKIFVLDDESLNGPAQRAGARSVLREAGGILDAEVSPACDYCVTDRPDIAEAAHRDGARKAINHLTLSVMIEGPR